MVSNVTKCHSLKKFEIEAFESDGVLKLFICNFIERASELALSRVQMSMVTFETPQALVRFGEV